MVTFSKYAKDFLIECGMFERQADEVVERMKVSPRNEPIKDLWEKGMHGYPESIQIMHEMSAKDEGLKYINEKCPNAWFKSMFES